MENNHQKLVRISSHAMVCLCQFKEHRISSHAMVCLCQPVQGQFNSCTPAVNAVLSFMHGMSVNGCLYNGVCAARSALPGIVTIKGYTKLPEHPFISCCLKGIYNRHPLCLNILVFWTYGLY